MKKTLQKKITLSILIVGFISTIFGLALIYYFGKSTLKKTIGAGFAEIADITSQKLESLIEHHIQEIHFLSSSQDLLTLLEKSNRQSFPLGSQEAEHSSSLAGIYKLENRWDQLTDQDPDLRKIIFNETSQYFRTYESNDQRDQGMHHFIFATDKNGIVVASDKKPPHFDYRQEKWWQISSSKERGKAYISDIIFDPDVKAYTFIIATPVFDKNGAPAGVLAMVHNADAFFKWVTLIKTGTRDHTMLVSSDGTILFCPIFPTKTHRLTHELQNKIFKSEPGWDVSNEDVHYPGRESLNGFAPLPITFHSGSDNFGGKNWYVFTSQDPLETFAPVYTLLRLILLAGFAVIGVLTFLGWFESKRIVKPIQDLQKGIQFIGNGHLDYRIDVKTGDEIEDVAHEFNEMAKKMKTFYLGLEQKVSERTIELETRTKELELRNNEMYTLFAMGATLNECESDEEILTVTPSKVLGMMKADGVLISLLNDTGEPPLKSLPTSIIKRDEIKELYRFILKLILQKGEPFIIENTADEEETKDIPIPSRFEFATLATVPLVAKRKIVGVLSLLFKKQHILTAQEEELLISIGHQVGNAIVNVQQTPFFKRTRN